MSAKAISGDKLLHEQEHVIKLIKNSAVAHQFDKESAEEFIKLFGGTLIKIVEEEVK